MGRSQGALWPGQEELSVHPDTFFDAVVAGDTAAVKKGLALHPDLVHARATAEQTPVEDKEWTALHLAAFHGQVDIVRALAEAGADMDARHGSDRTALLVALEYNNATCDTLIELGATVDVWAAAALEDLERLDEILSKDPASAIDPTGGLSPLGWAAFFNAADSARRLIEHAADVNDGSLFCAASTNGCGVGRVLLEAGAEANGCDQDGATAMHVAAAMRYTGDSRAFIELLLEYGAEVNPQAVHGLTPLDLALRCRASYTMEQRGRKIENQPLLPERDFDGVIELLRACGGQELSGPHDI